MAGGAHHERTHALPVPIPPKYLRYKGRIGGLMRKIGGLNSPEGRLDGYCPASRGADYAERFPSNQEFGGCARFDGMGQVGSIERMKGMRQQPTLETPRLVLRPFTLEDAPAVQRLAGAKEVAATMLAVPHPYEDGIAEQWISTH
jgi:hypothetical protein